MPILSSSSVVAWSEGQWKTPLLDVSTINNGSTWSTLRWKEYNTSDTTEAYVEVDILDSSSNVLLSDVTSVSTGNTREIDLSVRDTVNAQDIYIVFKLFSKGTTSPIVSEIEVF